MVDDGPGLFGGGSAPADSARGFMIKGNEDDFDPGDVLPNVSLFAHGLSRVLTSMR